MSNWDNGETVPVPAKPEHGNWTMAIEYLEPNKRLKFEVADTRPVPPPGPAAPAAAAGAGAAPAAAPAAPAATERNQWSYLQNRSCGADGDAKAPVNSANCLIADAPPGALIAKIGGSIAAKTSDAVKAFIVGSFCIIDLDDKTKGPLYLTINADPMAYSERDGKLIVNIYRSR